MNSWVYIILIALNSFIVIKMIKIPKVNLFMKILLGVSYFGWNAVHLLLTTFTDLSDYIIQFNPALYFFCNVANQVFLFFVFLFAYLLIKSKPVPKWIMAPDYQDGHGFEKTFTNISMIVVAYSIIGLITSTALYTDFDLTELSNDVESGVYTLISSFCRFFLIAMLLFRKPHLSQRKRNWIIILLVVFYLLQTIQGGRICIFGILILLFYLFFEHKNVKNAVLASVFLIISFALLPVIGELRQGGSKITASQVAEKSGSSSFERVLEEVVIKTNSVGYSTYLLASDGIGNAGALVYISQLYSLIPRFLYPDKPFGGSKDGTPMGTYSRYAANSISGSADTTGYNVGVSTSIISLWTLGWPMYIIHIFISAFFIFLFNCFFESRKPLFVLFALLTINYPVCVLDVSLDIIIRDVQRYIVIYFLIKLFYLSPKRQLKNSIQL